MKPVTLSYAEMLYAAMIGCQRQLNARLAGQAHRHGYDGTDAWQVDIDGATAELVASKALHRHWPADTHYRPGAADLDGDLEVRYTHRRNGRLIVHESDPDERVCYLVTGSHPDYAVVGWIAAGPAKRKEWWQDPAGGRPAYFIPQSALMPA